MNATQSWVCCDQVAAANFNRLKFGTGHSKSALRRLPVGWPLRSKVTGCVGKVCRGENGGRVLTLGGVVSAILQRIERTGLYCEEVVGRRRDWRIRHNSFTL